MCQASWDCKGRCARDHTDRPGGARRSSRTSRTSAESLPTIGCSAAAVSPSAKPKASTATTSLVGKPLGMDSEHSRNLGEGVGIAREPSGRVGAGRLRQHHAGEVEPAVGRSDAVESAETSLARVPTAVSVPKAVSQRPWATAKAEPTRIRRAYVRRPPIERRTVEGVLAEDAEGHLVGDGLADQGRPRIEQALHRPRVARRKGMLPGPVRVATAGRMPGHVEEILGGKRQAARGPPGESTIRSNEPGTKGLVNGAA